VYLTLLLIFGVIQGVSEELAREAFTLAAAKLPLKTMFTARTIM